MSTQDRRQELPLLPAFTDFVPEVVDRLQRVTDAYLEEFDEHKAFVYWMAELFETTNENQFTFTDGPGDGGIDFFIEDRQSYTVYQCKCPALETLENSRTVPSFDKTAVEEIGAAIRFLQDREGTYEVKREISRLRTDFHRDLATDPESINCSATLAILGELTRAAEKMFEAESRQLREKGVTLKLITWTDIYRELHKMETPADVDFSIRLHLDDPDKELLRHEDYCYVLAYAVDFYEAFREHEWNLFDWNVRLQLPRSSINKRIVQSLSKARSRKIFHHLNNGILITCRNYKIDETRKRITLVGPQVINGCQTVCAIRDAYEGLEPYEQQEFREQARVQVKVIQNVDPDFIGELVITTNDQNPMSPRNLKSNTSEQKDLQRRFRELLKSWFYQRKDGEMKSLLSTSRRVRWFKKSDYAVTRRRYRLIDNKQLAQDWYAFTGHSDLALKGGVHYFEQEDVYTRIFKSHPNDDFWRRFSTNAYFSPKDDHFDPGMPSVHQYLLARAVGEYVNSKRVGWRKNKREALQRGLEQGELKEDPATGKILSSAREVDDFLAKDNEYRLNIMLNNMREILIELFSFLLSGGY